MKADASQSVVALTLLSIAVVVFWFTGLTPGMPWGDDWAGYLLQAKALQTGTLLQELATNTRAMDGGDVQTGPYAYPWGYPILLAAAGVPSNWNFTALKALSLLSGLVLIWSTYAMARFRLRPAIAVAVTVMVALQSHVLLELNYMGSDIPFVALSGLGLWVILKQFHRMQAGLAPARGLMIAAAVLGAAAFSIRSNGALLPCTYVAMLALAVLQGSRSASETALHGLGFCAVTASLFALYLIALPDGSLVHASFLTLDPVVWMRRLNDHLNGLWGWFPFPLFAKFAKGIPLLLLVVLVARGVLRWPWDAAILATYAAMQLALLTLFPYDGGVRYYMPLLAPVLLLMGFGWQDVWDRWRARPGAARSSTAAESTSRTATGLLKAFVVPVAIAAVMIGYTLPQRAPYATPSPDAPYGAAMQAAVAWINTNAPPEARIGYGKSRAFRLLSGRTAYAISQPQNLARVDWYIFNPYLEPRLQVAESALRADATGFRLVFESGPVKVFARKARSDTAAR